MSENDLALGIDFGGTSVKVGVVFRSSIIDHAPPIATQDFEGPEPLIEELVRAIEDLRARHPHIAGVGIGMPGFINFEEGIVHNLTNVPGWKKFPLGRTLEDRIHLPVIVENDANCMAYAEWKRGSARGMDDVVALTLGTGVGGGIISGGRMIRGANFGAGEIGQTSIDWRGIPGAYGNLGALEDYIGNQEIAARARDVYSEKGEARSLTDCTPKQLALAAQQDDPIALEIWDEIAARLACALMNCCWLLNPKAIIVGGGVAKAGETLFNPLTHRLYAQLSPTFRDQLMVLPARFGNEAGAIGAAVLALEYADRVAAGS